MSEQNVAKILTIDDEFTLRKTIVAYLEDSGFEVIEAENGKQGLAILEEENPDLILLDLQMPEMKGLDVLTNIMKNFSDIPTIVLSGAGEVDDVIESLRRGACNYLTKPISDLAILEHAVCKSLERSRLIEENKLYRANIEKNLAVLKEDQEAGRSVQMRLLPEQNVKLGKYLFSHSFTPSLYLSGDFLDYFNINKSKIGFYLADISGHGAASAFVTILLKGLIGQIMTRYQTHDDEMILSPPELVANISKKIYRAKLGKYLTIIYCVLDIDNHELNYTVGGHYPNPIYIKDNYNKYLNGRGYPVGIMENTKYELETIKLEPNSYMTIFSDGVMEILPQERLQDKEDKLLEITINGKADNKEILKSLEITEEQGLPDDVTFLTIRRIT